MLVSASSRIQSRTLRRAARVIAAASLSSTAAAQPTITNLNVLAGGSPTYCNAEAISPDGSWIAGGSSSSSGQRAFRWTAGGGMQNLGALTGFSVRSFANALSSDGTVVVGSSQGAGNVARAFRWTAATGMQSLGVLGTGSISGARAVSADGSVIAGISYVTGFNGAVAMRWTAATGLQSLGGTGSNAAAITPDGSVIVGTDVPNGYLLPFRWTSAGGMQHLSIPIGADSGEGFAVSADGSIVVGYTGDQFNGTYTHAFRWTELSGVGGGQMEDLGALSGSSYAYAYAASADGSVVGGSSTLPSGDHAFLWSPTLRMVDLNTYLPTLGLDLTGWTLTAVRAISANGSSITGYGEFNGVTRSFLVSGIPVPPPIPCFANCDNSSSSPILNANDFQCFLNQFAAADAAANCDGSTASPTLNANDFQCFLNKFAAGCS